ncbi:MAG: DUF6868 family protein [Planctomycetota bacterium]
MNRNTLRSLSSVFGVCFLVCAGMQLFALAMILLLDDIALSWHARLFSIPPDEVRVAAYYFLTLMKTLGLTLFLTPWAALRIMAARLGNTDEGASA